MTKTKLGLLVVRGSLAGRRFNIAPGGSRLGRARSCEIEINDPVLSRHHCLFEMVGGSLRLTDLASANGTFVNGMELASRSIVLHPDDIVTVGGNTLAVIATEDRHTLSLRGQQVDCHVQDGVRV